jgi:multidrug efflux system outer membrane protein
MRVSWKTGLGLVVVILAGCKVGPDYARPEVPVSEAWRWKPAQPKDGGLPGEWWKVFGDPVLDGLEARAMEGNFDLQAALARVEQGRSLARISKADLAPGVSGGANWTRYRTSGNSPSPVPFPIPSFTQEQWTVPFDLTYEVDVWGRVRRSFEASRERAEASRYALGTVLLGLQADVAAAYFDLRSLDRQTGILVDAVELRREAAKIFEQRLEAGVGAEFELQRSRAELASAEADLLGVRRRREETLNSLAVFCGVAPSEFELELNPAELTVPEVVPGLPSELLERRPDVAQAERELAARNAEIGVAKGAFFPVVRLTAAGGYLSAEAQDLFSWESRIWQISPGISFPIFQGGRNKANLARAQAAYEEAVALYRQRVLVAFREVEDSLVAVRYLEKQANAREVAASSAKAAAELSLARYQAGSVDFLGVVDSENVRLLNEQLAVVAKRDRFLAVVRLIKALGGGWE